MVEFFYALGAFVGLATVLSGATLFALRFTMRRAAARTQAIDERLRPQEAMTGRCGACEGRGWRWGESAARPRTCWRCGGSGSPPGEAPSGQ